MAFRFKKFKVYQDAICFSKYCREVLNFEIKDRDLSNQIQRALNSIVLNIAEGSADNSDTEFARFLGISIRSVYEVVAGFDLALSYNLINEEIYTNTEEKAEELVRQLSAFRSKLKQK